MISTYSVMFSVSMKCSKHKLDDIYDIALLIFLNFLWDKVIILFYFMGPIYILWDKVMSNNYVM